MSLERLIESWDGDNGLRLENSDAAENITSNLVKSEPHKINDLINRKQALEMFGFQSWRGSHLHWAA